MTESVPTYPPGVKMLDRVTYAIMNAFFSRALEEQTFTASPVDNEDLARAALEALRKPTPAMIAAGETFVEYSAEACWSCMVDAALGGKGEG